MARCLIALSDARIARIRFQAALPIEATGKKWKGLAVFAIAVTTVGLAWRAAALVAAAAGS